MGDICYLVYDKRPGFQNVYVSNKNLVDLKKDIQKEIKKPRVIFDYRKNNNSDSKVTAKDLWFNIMALQNSEPGILELNGYTKNAWIIYFLENTNFILQNSSGEIRSSYKYKPENIPNEIVSKLLPETFLNEYKYLENKVKLNIVTKDGKKAHLCSYYKNLEIKEKKSFIEEYKNFFNIFEYKKEYHGLQILYHLFPDNKKSQKAFLRDYFPKDLIFLLVDLLEDTNDDEYVSLIHHLINKNYYINQKEKERILNSKNNKLNNVKNFLENKEKKTPSTKQYENTKEKEKEIENKNFDKYSRTFVASSEKESKETNVNIKIEEEQSYKFIHLKEKKKNTFYKNYPYNYKVKYNIGTVKENWLLNNLVAGIYVIKNKKTNTIYIGESINIHEILVEYYLDLKNNKHHNHKLQRDFNNECDILEPMMLEEIEVLPNNTYIEIKKKNIERKNFYIEHFKSLGFTIYNLEHNNENIDSFNQQYHKKNINENSNVVNNRPSKIINTKIEENNKINKKDVIKSFYIRLDAMMFDYIKNKNKEKIYNQYFNQEEKKVFNKYDFEDIFNDCIEHYKKNKKFEKETPNSIVFYSKIILIIFSFVCLFNFMKSENQESQSIIIKKENNNNNPNYNEEKNKLENRNIQAISSESNENYKNLLKQQEMEMGNYYLINNMYLSEKRLINFGFEVKMLNKDNYKITTISMSEESCKNYRSNISETYIYVDLKMYKIFEETENKDLDLKFIANYLCN